MIGLVSGWVYFWSSIYNWRFNTINL